MNPLTGSLLESLDLRGAFDDQAAWDRRYLPAQSWTQTLPERRDEFLDWLRVSLVEGHRGGRASFVPVRKYGHGIRSVAVMDPADEVTLHALAAALLPPPARVSREREDYVKFLLAPLKYARANKRPGDGLFGYGGFPYIVKSDVVNFYGSIDHNLLRREMTTQGFGGEVLTSLLELLREVMGGPVGIPQMFLPSDWLSDIYIDPIRRVMIRSGWPTWRFNDDFRVLCRGYTDALLAIERLSELMHDHQLTMSGQKTNVSGMVWYHASTTGIELVEEEEDVDLDDLEDVADDYWPVREEGGELDLDVPKSRLASALATDGDEAPIDELTWVNENHVKHLQQHELAIVRRALGAFSAAEDGIAIGICCDLVRFQPSITNSVAKYLIALSTIETDRCQDAIRCIIQHALGTWQNVWIATVIRECGWQRDHDFNAWLQTVKGLGPNAAGAAAMLALASTGSVTADAIDEALRYCPRGLEGELLAAAAHAQAAGSVSTDELNAFQDESTPWRLLARVPQP